MRQRIHLALKAPQAKDHLIQKEEEKELPGSTPPEFELKSQTADGGGGDGNGGGADGGASNPGGGDANGAAGGTGGPNGGAGNGAGGGNKGPNGSPKPNGLAQNAKDKKTAAKTPPPFQSKAGNKPGGKPTAAAPKAPQVFKGPKPKTNTTGLPDTVKSKIEAVLGMDFSGIKVKPNSRVAVKNQAQALVKGNEVHFAPGKFNPNSQQGQKLIGHEFAHFKQKSQKKVNPTGKLNGMAINESPSLEKEADAMGEKIANATQGLEEGQQLEAPHLHNDHVAQFSADPYARYTQMLEWAAEMKSTMSEKINTQKTDITTQSDTEKENLNTMLETAIETMNTSIDSAVTAITTAKDTTISTITEHRTAKIEEINTAADEEICKVEELVQTKKEKLVESGETRATRITTKGDEEAGRASSGSENNAGKISGIISSTAGNFQGKEGINEAVSEAQNNASDLSSKFTTMGDEMSTSLKAEASTMAESIRTDATESGSEFDQPMADVIAKINETRQDSNSKLEEAGTEFMTNLETETAEVIAELETQKTTQSTNLGEFPKGAEESLDKAVSDAHTVLDRENEKVLGEIDDFLSQLQEIGWHAEEIENAQSDLQGAITEHETEMTGFLEEAFGKMSEATSALQPELDDFVTQVQGILTDMESGFTTELSSKETEITGDMDTAATDTITGITKAAESLEPGLDEAVCKAEESWDEEVEKKETEMTEKVDEGLAGQESALSDFSSNLSSEFSKLPNKDRGFFEKAWDGIKNVASFIGGIFVGLAQGLWEMLKGLVGIFSSWANFLIAVAVIIVACAIIGVIAFFTGLGFLTVLLIVGIVVGLAMAGYYIYLAVTTEGLSPYERGKLVGRGIFEGIMAFVGTGVLARLLRWAGKIGQLGSIVAKAGGLLKFIPILTKIDDVGRVIALINKLDDAARLGPLVDKVTDANKLVTMLENAADAGRIMDILDSAGDVNAIVSKVDDVNMLVSLVDRAGDVGQLETLMTKVDDIAMLDNLLNQVDNGEQLGRLVDFFGDGAKLDDFLKGGSVTDAAALDDLITSRGFRDADQLGNMIDEAGSMDNLTSILDKTGDAGTAERYLQDLKTIKDRLAGSGLNVVDDGAGTLRYFDKGREVAVLENGTLRYTYGGYGGDIIIADPSDTVTVLGKYEDLMHPDWGTQYIVNMDPSMMQPTTNFPGGISGLDVPTNQWKQLVDELGEVAGTQKFWDDYNEPFIRNAMDNGNTIRLISDPTNPLTRTSTYLRELELMESIAASYGYVFDAATNSYIPAFKAGTP